ncbi:MAG: methyltransferase domain-containing protein [Bryobacteraceae bacterium]|nr:methyltransferase domain-containing protein [Bryobacteraceae bacterium]
MQWLRRLFGSAPPPISADLSEIRRSFEESAADEEHFPSTIDPRIYHVQVVTRHLTGVTSVLDVGSGKGRFARIIKQENPAARVVCLDLALAMLRAVDANLQSCAGVMTQLPFRDATFDGVYATESLEHAVDIETAVAEMCRVLAPGGRLVIIDKNAEHWGRLATPAWEKWFHRTELEKLLRRHCREVTSRPISYWEDVPPDGLFLAWTAVK